MLVIAGSVVAHTVPRKRRGVAPGLLRAASTYGLIVQLEGHWFGRPVIRVQIPMGPPIFGPAGAKAPGHSTMRVECVWSFGKGALVRLPSEQNDAETRDRRTKNLRR